MNGALTRKRPLRRVPFHEKAVPILIAFDLGLVISGMVQNPRGSTALSGLKDQIRRVRPGFSEKPLGYRSFLQFVRAADTTGVIRFEWDTDADDYLLTLPPA